MSQPKILSQWNEASASDRATDKSLCHLGALSQALCWTQVFRGGYSGKKRPLGSAKYDAQQHPTTALPPKEPWLHDLEESHTRILTLLQSQGK